MVYDIQFQTALAAIVSCGAATFQVVLAARHLLQTQICPLKNTVKIGGLNICFQRDFFFARDAAVGGVGKAAYPGVAFFQFGQAGASGGDLIFLQNFFVQFYQAFLEGDRWLQYLKGVETTLLVTAMSLVLGIVLGVLVAMIRTAHDQQRPGHKNPILFILNLICKIYVTVIRGTPMMVQLLIMGLVIFANSRNFTMVGSLTLGINSGAYVAEIIRGGLMSVDKGQMEAGRSLGLNYIQTMRFIIIPQAIKAILPALGNEFIVLLKDTSLITVIGGKELLYAARGIMNRTYEQMFPLLGTAAIYLVLVMIFTWLLGILERRLRQGDRR